MKKTRPRKTSYLRFALLTVLCWCGAAAHSDNPIVSHVYTADPTARVFNDRMYVITSHDLDNQDGYNMVDYYLFSSDDMVNWTDHGIIFDVRSDTTWAGLAYAPDFIERNGKYYMYFPDGANGIGVAVADQPEGPWLDAIGRALINRNTPGVSGVSWVFDPGVYIDEDGSAYLYFGGGSSGNNLRVIRLNDDMISVNGSAQTIVAPNYFEAPFVIKRDGVYYLSYSTNGDNGGITIDYMTSDNPMTGFTHRGTALPNPWTNQGNNNHHSMVEWRGQWYMFYHNRAVSQERGAGGYQRSINVDRMTFNGTTITSEPTRSGVDAIKSLDPFSRIEGETIDKESGVETNGYRSNPYVEYDAQDWVKISNVDFASGATFLQARFAANNPTELTIFLDSMSGSPAATITIPATGGLLSWDTLSHPISGFSGEHDVFIRANGRFNLDWYTFITEPQDCGDADRAPICCDIRADRDRDGWGKEWGEDCLVTPETEGYAPLNSDDVEAAINVGADTGDYFNGVYYQPDVYANTGTARQIGDSITGAGGSAVFQSERYGDFAYEIPVENGHYSVSLHFVEMYWDTAGSRTFDAVIEDQVELTNLDIYQEVGKFTAYTRDFEAEALDGSLSIDINTTLDNGTLSGILIRRRSPNTGNSSSTARSSSSSAANSSSGAQSGSGSSSGSSRGGVINPQQLLWMLISIMVAATAARRME